MHTCVESLDSICDSYTIVKKELSQIKKSSSDGAYVKVLRMWTENDKGHLQFNFK